MAREFESSHTLPYRIECPECRTSWSTCSVPSYCPNDDCGALVTFRTIKWTARELRRADGKAKALAAALRDGDE